MNDIDVQAHSITARQNIHVTAARLVGHLGATAVSYLAGAKDQRQASRWARADGPEPRHAAASRLIAAHRIWMMLSAADDDYVARNWFIGANPRLGDRPPIEALRDGEVPEVLAAARSFLEGAIG